MLALSLSRESKCGPYVFAFKIWEVCQDLRFRHPRCQVLEYVIYRYPKPANARLSTSFVRVQRDAFKFTHG